MRVQRVLEWKKAQRGKLRVHWRLIIYELVEIGSVFLYSFYPLGLLNSWQARPTIGLQCGKQSSTISLSFITCHLLVTFTVGLQTKSIMTATASPCGNMPHSFQYMYIPKCYIHLNYRAGQEEMRQNHNHTSPPAYSFTLTTNQCIIVHGSILATLFVIAISRYLRSFRTLLIKFQFITNN